jgi:cytochrome c-type biogenesis protein CcmH/NrfG
MAALLRLWYLSCAAIVLAGCAAAAAIVPDLLLDNADLFASAIGDYGVRPEFRDAVPVLQKKDWRGLIVLARQKLDRNPSRGEWWQLAGYAHIHLGEVIEARDCFVQVTKLMPEDVNGWNFYAYTLMALKDTRAATAAVNHAIEINPDSDVTYVIIGELDRQAGSQQPALQAYQRAIEINGDNAVAWLGVGVLAKHKGDTDLYDKAKNALRKLAPQLVTLLEKA